MKNTYYLVGSLLLFSLSFFSGCKKQEPPSLTTVSVTQITTNSAKSGGVISNDGNADVTSRGLVWARTQNPSLSSNDGWVSSGSGMGTFTGDLTGLLSGTNYYVKAYATNSEGTAYGNELPFTTNPVILATVTTAVVTSITSTMAVSGGNVTSDGGAAVTERGVCWSTALNPITSGNKTTDGTGTGTFTSSLTSLSPKTTYYVRAYATNISGTAYGSNVQFTTLAVLPTVTTNAQVTGITPSSAVSGGNVTSDGGAAVTTKGVCWTSGAGNPTITDSHTTDGSGTGIFTSNLTQLIPNTIYKVRAYATNSVGTAYGDFVTFTTSPIFLATVTTNTISYITTTSATGGGNISDDGGAAVTERGICWSTALNPTTSGDKTTEGTGTGTFTSNLTGLSPSTTYYVRAYALNSAGTSYGTQNSFTTLNSHPDPLTDIDGNSYNIVTIGTQYWMAENLKTTKYKDGTNIPLITDSIAWYQCGNTTPGYCWYKNNEANKITYGALYNWNTVNTGNLCPAGWHVPSDTEWTTLENYLISNGYNYDGTTSDNKYSKALASATGWNLSTNTGAVGNTDYPAKRNSTGFTGLPAGTRMGTDGAFRWVREAGYWWSATERSSIEAWSRNMDMDYADLYRGRPVKDNGSSVRCIKD